MYRIKLVHKPSGWVASVYTGEHAEAGLLSPRQFSRAADTRNLGTVEIGDTRENAISLAEDWIEAHRASEPTEEWINVP